MHARVRACNVQARTLLLVWPWPMRPQNVPRASSCSRSRERRGSSAFRRSSKKPPSHTPAQCIGHSCHGTYCAQQLHRIHRCRAVSACSSRRSRSMATLPRRRCWRTRRRRTRTPRTSSCCVSSRYAAASPMGTRSAHGASCLLRVAREHLLAPAAPDPLFGSTLFVCLFGRTDLPYRL